MEVQELVKRKVEPPVISEHAQTIMDVLAYIKLIPEDKWWMGAADGPNGSHCYIGHSMHAPSTMRYSMRKVDAMMMDKYHTHLMYVNDQTEVVPKIWTLLPTPKQRVVCALEHLLQEYL